MLERPSGNGSITSPDQFRHRNPQEQTSNRQWGLLGGHRFDVGQPVSYAEDGKPEIWRGGYEIVRICDPGSLEPQYAIRNADQSYDRIVREHELCEDLGARVRGQ